MAKELKRRSSKIMSGEFLDGSKYSANHVLLVINFTHKKAHDEGVLFIEI